MNASAIRIVDVTRGVTLVSAGRVAATIGSSFRGLMLTPPLPHGAGLLIAPCRSIHTHFMRFPIDVIYANRENVVVGIDRNLRPWRLGRFYRGLHYVIELPAGDAEACQVGDQLEVTSVEE